MPQDAKNEIVCLGCGAVNRVTGYSVEYSPRCGRCSGDLPEPRSVRYKRAFVRYWRLVWICIFILGGLGLYAHDALLKKQETAQTCIVSQPATGRYARYDPSPLIAPLTIRTQVGNNYFIKFEEAGTSRPIMTMFARGGETIQHRMPIGTFTLKYATGETWCGERLLFGSSTQVHETGKLFSFDGDHSFTVELIRQKNGNLPVRSIGLQHF